MLGMMDLGRDCRFYSTAFFEHTCIEKKEGNTP